MLQMPSLREVVMGQCLDQGQKLLTERREICIHQWATIINHKLVNNSNNSNINSKIIAC